MNEVQNEKKVSTGVVVLITLLVVLLVGCISFIVYDKFIKKDNSNPTVTDKDKNNEAKQNIEISLSDPIITSLVYPTDASVRSAAIKSTWSYKNINVSQISRADMMFDAATYVKYTSTEKNNEYFNVYSASEIEKNFKKIYGPDTTYSNANIVSDESCVITDYNEKDNTYTSSSGCGGDSCDFKDVVSKIYKAEKDPNEEYIYVYSYTQKVEGKCDSNFETIETYLVDKNDTKTKTLYTEDAGQYSEKYKSTINEMIDNKEVETYKWTFKKQSDGKYYFYSGEWQ